MRRPFGPSGSPAHLVARVGSAFVLVVSVVLAVLIAPGARAESELLPLRPGMLLMTSAPTGTDRWVLSLMDTRRAECSASPGSAWAVARDHNLMPNPTSRTTDEWTFFNLGTVFGLALDDASPPSVYVSATTVFSDAAHAPARIFRIDGATGAVRTFATLPSPDDYGLGNIAFDPVHEQLLVTNFADGMLYRLSMDGEILGTFDPFLPHDPSYPRSIFGLAPPGERIWGVAAWQSRVYFGTWTEARNDHGSPNGVYSVALDDGGAFVGEERVELVLPPRERRTDAESETSPISDLAFTPEGTMLVAERSMEGEGTHTRAREARVLEFVLEGGTWRPSGRDFLIGSDEEVGSSDNAAGGVAHQPCVADATCPGAAAHVLATGDCIRALPPDEILYGVQVLPASGGGPDESRLIDLDGDPVNAPTSEMGDVEAVPLPPTAPMEMGLVTARDLRECGLGVSITWEPVEPPSADARYSVFRSELDCADALAGAPIASDLDALELVDDTTRHGAAYWYAVSATSTAPRPCGTEAETVSACVSEPVAEVALPTFPEPAWSVLRARHEGDFVTFEWPDVRSLLEGEHFHLLKSTRFPPDDFSLAHADPLLATLHEEEDASAPLQFFDLRIANACEVQSVDEYPPGWDA